MESLVAEQPATQLHKHFYPSPTFLAFLVNVVLYYRQSYSDANGNLPVVRSYFDGIPCNGVWAKRERR